MFIYLTIFLIIAFFGFYTRTRSTQNLTILSLATLLLIFMGTRYETGCDYTAYESRFYSLYYDHNYLAYLTREEPGFHLLNLLVHALGLDYIWLNIFSSFIFLFGLIRFLRISPAPILLLALMFPIVVVQLGMSGIRQALALSFLLQALVGFVQLRRIETGIFIIIAAQFHQSAYLFLPLALMVGKKFSIPLATVSLALLGPLAILFLGERAEVYSDRYIQQIYGENASGGAVLRYILALAPCIVFEIYAKKVKALLPNLYPLLRTFSLITIALTPVGLLSTVALHRMTFYVLPVALMIFLCTIMSIPKKQALSRKWLLLPAGTLGLYLIGWFGLSKHAELCFLPYDSFILN